MVSIPRLVDEVFRLLDINMYGASGVLEGSRLYVSAFREGATNVYSYKPGEGLVRLNSSPISMTATPPYGASRVIVARDVAAGRELHLPFEIRVEEPGVEKPLAENLDPMRILGLVDAGDRIVITGVTERGIEVFEIVDGEARSVTRLPGLAAVADVAGRKGVGILFQETGKIPLITVDLDTGDVRVHDTPGSVQALRASPEGWVAVGVEGARSASLYRFDPETGSLVKLDLEGQDLEDYKPTMVVRIEFDTEGRPIVIAGRQGRTRVFHGGHYVPGPEGVYTNALEWQGGLVASYTSLTAPPRILFLSGGSVETLLADDVPDWLKDALGSVIVAEVESVDGESVPTLALESGRAGRPGPTVVLVHGGPFAADMDAWSVFAAALALTGYNVVMPNYRGSTGFGEEWRTKIIGDPCGIELEDIVAAARWARESGLARDTVIMGYSYGGYMTMCALTRKPRTFRAGVAGASVVDWEEMYELSDPAFKAFIELLFAGDKSKWKERSPVTYIDNLQDPLVIIHPQNDSRTPLKPVLHFMEKALEKGKRFEAHIAPDMGHGVHTKDDAVKILLPAILFLARLLEDKNQNKP